MFCYDSEKMVDNRKNEGEKKRKNGVGVGYCEENVKINTTEIMNRERKQNT